MSGKGLTRRAVVLDGSLAVLLSGAGIASGLSGAEFSRPGADVALLMAVAGAAQSVRRRWSLAAFTCSFVAMGAIALRSGHYESGICLLVAIVATWSAVGYAADLLFVVAGLVAYSAVLNLGQPLSEAVPDLLFTLTALGLVVGAAVAVRAWRDRTAAADGRVSDLEDERAAAAVNAAEEERRRIARELHDILAHSLSVVALQAGAAEEALDKDLSRARAAIGAVRATAQEALNEVQTLVRVVRSPEQPDLRAPQPTLSQLPRLVEQTRAAGLAVELRTQGSPCAVPAALQTSLYRVAQEGLANALKHAGTGGTVLALRYQPGEVQIEVLSAARDGERGPGSRLGLVGVRERATVFGGRVEAGPGPGGTGWDLRATFPLPR